VTDRMLRFILNLLGVKRKAAPRVYRSDDGGHRRRTGDESR
jgi:hypothetical protein